MMCAEGVDVVDEVDGMGFGGMIDERMGYGVVLLLMMFVYYDVTIGWCAFALCETVGEKSVV